MFDCNPDLLFTSLPFVHVLTCVRLNGGSKLLVVSCPDIFIAFLVFFIPAFYLIMLTQHP